MKIGTTESANADDAFPPQCVVTSKGRRRTLGRALLKHIGTGAQELLSRLDAGELDQTAEMPGIT